MCEIKILQKRYTKYAAIQISTYVIITNDVIVNGDVSPVITIVINDAINSSDYLQIFLRNVNKCVNTINIVYTPNSIVFTKIIISNSKKFT